MACNIIYVTYVPLIFWVRPTSINSCCMYIRKVKPRADPPTCCKNYIAPNNNWLRLKSRREQYGHVGPAGIADQLVCCLWC